jgi:hypothetical protein
MVEIGDDSLCCDGFENGETGGDSGARPSTDGFSLETWGKLSNGSCSGGDIRLLIDINFFASGSIAVNDGTERVSMNGLGGVDGTAAVDVLDDMFATIEGGCLGENSELHEMALACFNQPSMYDCLIV